MSAPATRLSVVGSKKQLRSVEVAQRAEADSWALADAIFDDVAELRPELNALDRSRADGVKTGITEVEEEIASEMGRAGLDYDREYIHQLYVTRRAWPPNERVEAASFTAHHLLRSQTYEGKRGAILERLANKSKTGRVTAGTVRFYIAERKPRQQWTFLQLVDRRVRTALKAAANPWHTVTQDDRESIARLMRALAHEIEEGTFPRKAKR